MRKKLLFVATTPFAVNAFLRSHLLALAEEYDVILCVNLLAYPLAEDLHTKIMVEHVDIARKTAPLSDLRALLQLLRIFLRIRPDAVHSITPKAGLLAMLAAFLTRVPHRFHTFTGQVWATKQGLGRWALQTFDRMIVRFSTTVFADSTSQCRLMEAEKVVRQGQISVLGPGSIAGVDIHRFRPNAQARTTERAIVGTPADALVFLFVGRLVKDKGIFDLLQAYSSAAARYPQTELWVVGPDEEGLLADLQRIAASSPGRIRWCGPTNQPETFMAAADVLVLPSYREGFGSVVIEAAACSIPTLAYRIDGIVDAVIDQYTGLLSPVRDVEALTSTLLRLCTEKSLLKKLGTQAYARVTGSFTSSAITSIWMEFYNKKLQDPDLPGHMG